MVRRPVRGKIQDPRTVGRWHDGKMARWQKQALSYIYMIGPVASCCDPSSVSKFRRLLSGISMVPRLTMIVRVTV